MGTFERKLTEALRAYHIGDTTPKDRKDDPKSFTNHSYKLRGDTRVVNTSATYAAVKYYKILSQKLSRLTHHDIVILVGNGLEQFAGGPSGRLMRIVDKEAEVQLSKMTNIPVEAFKESVTLLIIGDNEQSEVSPWLILHQLGEAIVDAVGDPWYGFITKKYKKHFMKAPDINVSQELLRRYKDDKQQEDDELVHPYADDASSEGKAFHHLFKMKSAREFLHGSFDNIDPGQEIIVEYLWHGGHIRMNYPEWIDSDIVDNIKRDLITWIDNTLTKLKGHRLTN